MFTFLDVVAELNAYDRCILVVVLYYFFRFLKVGKVD
jgi:hypothetical protein